ILTKDRSAAAVSGRSLESSIALRTGLYSGFGGTCEKSVASFSSIVLFITQRGEPEAGILPARKPELQCLQHMTPIGVRIAMIAVMKQHDVAFPYSAEATTDSIP